MAEWLIIIGVTALLTATLALVREARHHGDSGVFFWLPLLSVRQVQRNWEAYRFWVLLRIAGGLLALLGGLLWWQHYQHHQAGVLLSQQQSGQVVRGSERAHSTAFVTSQEGARLLSRGEGQALAGELQGRPFHYQRVSLVNGVLSAVQGEGFYADLELRILLGEQVQSLSERRTWRVRPSDPQAPTIHVSWLDGEQTLPETEIYQTGYALELTLAPLDRHRLSGSLALLLPDSFKSYLVGNFTVNKNNLRYRQGQVDLSHDHADTLVYVVDQFLQTQFPEGALLAMETEQVQLRRSQQQGVVQVKVTLSNGAEQRRWVQLSKRDLGWVAHASGMQVEELRPPRAGELRIVEAAPFSPRRSSSQPASLPQRRITVAELAQYQGRSVTLLRHRGEPLQAVIRGLDNDHLQIEERMGSGVVTRRLPLEQLRALELGNGQLLVLSDSIAAKASASVEPAGSTGRSSAGTDSHQGEILAADSPLAEQLAQYQRLLGREVTVTPLEGRSRDGVLVAVDAYKIRLAVPMGAGNVEYSYDLNTLQRIEARP